MQFRKKPVVIEAMQYVGPDREREAGELAGWLQMGNATFMFSREGVDITTLEGVMRADVGDWIIKGVKGEFYPCKPDIFEQTYEAV